jgi:hypothetical protein
MRSPNPGYRSRGFAGGADPGIRVDPSSASADKNVVRGPAPRNPDDNEQGMRKGGKVKATGPVKVHKGEQVIRKASAQKYGAKKMASVNKGTAKVTVPKRSKR